MPLIKRAIEPVQVSRSVVPTHVRNELEFVSNSTLSSIIQQLSSLSKHAEDVFGELHRETCCVLYRSGQLDDRIDRLKQKILQLNPTVEEEKIPGMSLEHKSEHKQDLLKLTDYGNTCCRERVSLQDINMRKPFKSSVTKDQQIIAHSSRSQAVTDKYNICDAAPALHKLDPYREDGKSSVKFYTDPGYFFELWCHEMKLDAETNLQKQKKKNKNRGRSSTDQQQRTIREPKSHTEEDRFRRHGPEFVENFRKEGGGYQTPSVGSGSLNEVSQRPGSLEIQKLSKAAEAYGGKRTSGSDYGYIFSNGQSGTLRHGSTRDQQGTMSQSQRGINGGGEYPSDSGYSRDSLSLTNSIDSRRSPEPRSPGSATPTSRPLMPPPAPPPGGSVQRVPSNRDSLPPPPSLPTPTSHQGPSRPVARHGSDLPPPPSPPPPLPSYAVDEYLPSPPPVPLGEINGSREDDFSILPPPPPPPSLPPPNSSLLGGSQWDRSRNLPPTGPELLHPPELTLDNVSDSSSVTTAVSNSSSSAAHIGRIVEEKPRDNRSDLLAAIREGLQLRKVEERRLQTERKQTEARLDVQSIMEAAFEMRRKAMESNDSDKENDEDDFGNWSD